MTIRRIRKDPRTQGQRDADAAAVERFERGDFLTVDPSVRRAAIEHVRRRSLERRERVAALGQELGRYRRALGVTQEEVARAIGTRKTNVSRVESGRYGGLTLERFFAMVEAIRTGGGKVSRSDRVVVSIEPDGRIILERLEEVGKVEAQARRGSAKARRAGPPPSVRRAR